MKNILTIALLAALQAPLFAAEPGPALLSLKAAAGEAPVTEFGHIIWYDIIDDLIVNDAWRLNFDGRTYYIRLGFRRGQYDAAAKTYKARAALMPFEILQTVDEITSYNMWPIAYIDEMENNNSYEFHPAEGVSIEIFNVDGVLEAWHNTADAQTRLARLPLKELYGRWAAWAATDYVTFGGRDFYMTPQVFFEDGVVKYGVVVSRDEPLHPATGEPQDFVELFRREANMGEFSYRETAYSLPLALTFRLGQPVEGGFQLWQITPMKKAEVQAAQNEMLSGRARKSAIPYATGTGRRGLK